MIATTCVGMFFIYPLLSVKISLAGFKAAAGKP